MATGRTLLAVLCAVGLACAGLPFSFQPGKVDEDGERDVGQQVDAAIRSQVDLIDDPVVLGFVNELGQRIVETLEPQPFIYRFRVIDQPTLNAFAIPGGYIYFHSETILEAASLDELAGVMAHEIAHVKGRHYARGAEKAYWPTLLARAAGIAATVATADPTPMAAAEGVNIALQLKYTREFEREADELGSTFMARSGFEPKGMGRFFERIVAAEASGGIHIPPYLFSHPQLEERIAAAARRSDTLTVTGERDPTLDRAFRAAQARLALLVNIDRQRWLVARPYDAARADPLLSLARTAVEAGDRTRALSLLREAEGLSPRDPRLSFEQGLILEQSGRTGEAIAAWRRTIALDPNVALAFYRLGNAYKRLGERHAAAYYLEQAERRFTPGGRFQERTVLALETLTHPPVTDAGLADGSPDDETPAGRARTEFTSADPVVAWWARIDKRYDPVRARIRVRWIDPLGETVLEDPVERLWWRRVSARLEFTEAQRNRFGIWRVEASVDGQVIDRRTFRYGPETGGSSSPEVSRSR
ncbi:MAG: M48 family metalloprotease [Myxococcales bacterium]|nr:M48 family metalloprotease [Myxococcales bacterium]